MVPKTCLSRRLLRTKWVLRNLLLVCVLAAAFFVWAIAQRGTNIVGSYQLRIKLDGEDQLLALLEHQQQRHQPEQQDQVQQLLHLHEPFEEHQHHPHLHNNPEAKQHLRRKKQQQQIRQQHPQQRQQHQHQQQQQQQQQIHHKQHVQNPHPQNSKHLQTVKHRMKSRLQLAQKFCSRKTKQRASNQTTYRFKTCPLTSTRPPSEFCPIAKIGSTFWTRFYKVLTESSSNVLDSPYTVPLQDIEKMRCGEKENASVRFRKPVRVMFAREPLSRMFSAFVDKLLSPNPIYWAQWGKPAMLMDGVAKGSVRCGEKVTFRQFLRFVNKRLYRENNHVIPMVGICDPCRDGTPYDVIGNMETFPDDLDYMMSLLNVTFGHDVQLSRDTKLDAIFDSIQGPFGWMQSVKKCVSTPEMGRRIWRKLQIRGLISSTVHYPLGQNGLTNITLKHFYNLAVKAHEKSKKNKHGLTRQKHQAFLEAFRSVPLSDLRKFVQIYEQDFEAFGYDKYPSSVFNRSAKLTDTKTFEFNRPWKIPTSL